MRDRISNVVAIVTTSVFLMLMTTSLVFAQVKQRPIEDFVNTQGTYCLDDGMGGCFLFVPPINNFMGSGTSDGSVLASVDYSGQADKWMKQQGDPGFGTTYSGSIIEKPMADGRAEVHIELKTNNALCWAVNNDFVNGFNSALAFGVRAPDVLNDNKTPALCTSHYKLMLINTAPGAPMPDLIQYFTGNADPRIEVSVMSVRATGKGSLPDGTPATLTVSQTGLMSKADGSGKSGVHDGWPVELINIKANSQ